MSDIAQEMRRMADRLMDYATCHDGVIDEAAALLRARADDVDEIHRKLDEMIDDDGVAREREELDRD